MHSIQLVAATPPDTSAERTPWDSIAEALRLEPGKWFICPQPWASSTNVTRGDIAAFRPAGAYQARRANGTLFIRYVGIPK